MKIKPDKQKAAALLKMADITFNRLKESDMLKYPTNTLTDYYDILHKLMEALTYQEGMKFSGEGAHAKLIDHVCRKYKLSEGTRKFLQQIRDFRNRISYEGFIIKQDFIKRNSERIEKIIAKLKKKLQI